MEKQFYPGTIVSADITIPDAGALKDFYTQVIGWQTENMPMKDEAGDYADFIMKDTAGNWMGGVCHARGVNNDLPPQWIVYVNVADVLQSIEKCLQLGGKVLKEAKNEDGITAYALLQDPVGAIIAITRMPSGG